jgi:hypothetical protein
MKQCEGKLPMTMADASSVSTTTMARGARPTTYGNFSDFC